MSVRLDQAMVKRRLVTTRSQAENYIKMGRVLVDGRTETKPARQVSDTDKIRMTESEQYVSRAGHKLASIAAGFDIDFTGKTVLDVGSSTGGFTDFALQHGAQKVYAVDVGTQQMHAKLRHDSRIELHEKTDIRDFAQAHTRLKGGIDVVLIDVSFISMRQVLPAVFLLSHTNTRIVAMLKPQFEAGKEQINKGVIKNERIRRDILQSFEQWVKQYCVVLKKADSGVSGEKGNVERFYLLAPLKQV